MKRIKVFSVLMTLIVFATSSLCFAQAKDNEERQLEALLQRAKEIDEVLKKTNPGAPMQAPKAQAALDKYRSDRAAKEVAVKLAEEKKKKDADAAAAALAVVNAAIAKKAKEDEEKKKKEQAELAKTLAFSKAAALEQLKQDEEKKKKEKADLEKKFVAALLDTEFAKSVGMDEKEARAIIIGEGDYNKAASALSKFFVVKAPDVLLKGNVEVNFFGKTMTHAPIGICEAMRTAIPMAIEAEFKPFFVVPGAKSQFELAFKQTFKCGKGYVEAFRDYASKDPQVAPLVKKYEKGLEMMLVGEMSKLAKSYAGEAEAQSKAFIVKSGNVLKQEMERIAKKIVK